MDVEARQRDVVGVGEEASLARALPGMLLRFIRNFSRQRFPDLSARSVEADPHRRAGGEGEYGAAQLALQIEHQVIFGGAQRGDQPRRADVRRRSPRRRPFVAGKFDDIADRGILPQQFGDLGRHQPIDARLRIAPPQFVEHRKRVHDVADRRQLDQQDLLKIAAAEIVSWHGCVRSRKYLGDCARLASPATPVPASPAFRRGARPSPTAHRRWH